MDSTFGLENVTKENIILWAILIWGDRISKHLLALGPYASGWVVAATGSPQLNTHYTYCVSSYNAKSTRCQGLSIYLNLMNPYHPSTLINPCCFALVAGGSGQNQCEKKSEGPTGSPALRFSWKKILLGIKWLCGLIVFFCVPGFKFNSPLFWIASPSHTPNFQVWMHPLFVSTQGLYDASEDGCDEEGEEESGKEEDPEIEPPSSSKKNKKTPELTEEMMKDKELGDKGEAKKKPVTEVTEKREGKKPEDRPVEGNVATKPSPLQETKNVPPSLPALPPAPEEQERTLLAYCLQHWKKKH